MRLFTAIAGLRCYLSLKRSGAEQTSAIAPAVAPSALRVGLVPTMGALHDGHLSLIHRARQENDCVIVSIFVNPLQFGPNEDLQQYPRPLEQDCHRCELAGVDAIFAPTVNELYGTPTTDDKAALTQVIPPLAMMNGLCGPFRPGHFPGVATVVTKLLSIVQPDRAYFGQKDAQQLAILRRVVEDLNLPVELVSCATVREAGGLALSSRNRYLTEEERSQASVLYRSLQQAEHRFSQGERTAASLVDAVYTELATVPAVQPQYVELVHPDTMTPLQQITDRGLLAIAAYLGRTRLIDNILLNNRAPIIAIDGPAGAGKSTVSRRVAGRLGLLYLDTGAMYRAVTWLVLQSPIPLNDEPAIADLIHHSTIHLSSGQSATEVAPLQVWVNGEEVTQTIRSENVTENVSTVAAQPAVRQFLLQQQRDYGRKGGIVIDGRDIGTHVFPDAELKIYLTASVQERARRRQVDLKEQGQPEVDLETLEQSIFERDRKDSTRAIAPLRKAADAIEIHSDGLNIEEVTETIVNLYRCLRS